MNRFARLGIAAIAALSAPLISGIHVVQAQPAELEADDVGLEAVDVVQGLQIPWDAAFLPDGTALITERNTARILARSPGGQLRVVQTLTQVVRPRGEGGLLGIAVSPTFQSDGLVYVYFTATSDNRIARMRLGQTPQTIVSGIPASNIHNGGRIAFGPDGMLYATTGDGSNTSNAQNLNSLGGKILRMTPTGAPAPGNPFVNSRVYSLGHRNVQGLAWDSAGRLYASEFGQNRFDELNRIRAGGNYGWPNVEGMGNDSRFINPLVVWTTAEASPSGIAIRGNNIFVACLRGQKVFRVGLDGNGGVSGSPQALFTGQFGRLRKVVLTPGGALWTLTSNRDGRGTPRTGDDRIIDLQM
jgi:glucose/arabinose dehydrogenase